MYKLPLHYLAIIRGFTSTHKGVDFGWNSKQDGANAPIYASADGVVCATNDNDNTGKSWGNYVKIKHNDTEYTLYAHLSHGLQVTNGQSVKQGDLLGYMGSTGDSTGNHLHFEFYKGGASTSYRVNALDYCYATEEQVIHPDDTELIKVYKEPIIEEPTNEEEFKVGDKVKVYGVATASSDGYGSKTLPYEGEERYITLIKEGTTRPYHISVGSTLGDQDRGWVAKDQLTKI